MSERSLSDDFRSALEDVIAYCESMKYYVDSIEDLIDISRLATESEAQREMLLRMLKKK